MEITGELCKIATTGKKKNPKRGERKMNTQKIGIIDLG